jgi:hypothetical protein
MPKIMFSERHLKRAKYAVFSCKTPHFAILCPDSRMFFGGK